MGGYDTMAYCVKEPKIEFSPLKIERHPVGDHDIHINIKYCGVCHTDLHFIKNDMGNSIYPCVPGHEIVGHVDEVGRNVTKFKVGDAVGIGCFVDSCAECHECKRGDEQYCQKGSTFTYNGIGTFGRSGPIGQVTYGGYSSGYTVHENYAIALPADMDIAKAAPLQCAAITVFDPLRHWEAGPGKVVGIVGIGGLGMMGLKIAKAMGCDDVIAFTSSPSKVKGALALGASKVCVTSSEEEKKKFEATCDLILNTVSAKHEVETYLPFLRNDGVIVQLGVVTEPHTFSQLGIVFSRKSIAGSLIGGIRRTQECVDFCYKHNILPDIELIPMSAIEDVLNKLEKKNDQIVRYVIDIENTMVACHS